MNLLAPWMQLARELTATAADAVAASTGAADAAARPELMPTPRDVVAREGTARLYRFVGDGPRRRALPILLVPSLINRWYVLDLRPGASLVAALVGAGHDVFCLDWGVPEDEDRHRDWDDVLHRLRRMARRTLRLAGAERLGLLGYCMGGTLTAIHAALHPGELAALVNLAGPIDFAKGGMLRRMVDRAWFDADAIADAGNVSPEQMQAGFTALRPTLELGKWASMPELAGDRAAQVAFRALDAWSSDNVPFPAAAYRTYIGQLYQDNRLVAGTHRALGRAVDLGAIRCPTMAIVADRDTICPPDAATALCERVGTRDTTVLRVPGGHVGAVVGGRAARELYPALAAWFADKLAIDPANVC
ncbi:MAG TPA: alpha/beta fold hydrolase [Kofleriaceae bacterium]|nr:alpha/beta fold hydrolase [Kofleriaceae bacterium]